MTRRRATKSYGGKRRDYATVIRNGPRYRSSRTRRSEAGNAVLELVILAPPFLLLLVFLIGTARIANAHQVVDDAAGDAARAASQTRTVTAANLAAGQSAAASMSGRGVSCTQMAVTLDSSNWRPGGVVAVTLSCTVVLNDLGVPGLGGDRVITAKAASNIDRYRSLGATP